MKKFLKLSLLAVTLATSGILSAAGLWGSSRPRTNPAPKPATPQITVQKNLPARPTTPAAVRPGTPVTRPVDAAPARDGEYTDKDNLCRYIVAYGTLPRNFITKNEARRLGWTGGPLEPYAHGKSIGGDRYGNYERTLPNGRYRECDVDTRGRPRGAKRIVFSDDRRVYYSSDHYRTFQRLH